MPALADLLSSARASYARRDWPDAYDGLKAAQQNATLSADDLHALADAAWWLGLIKETLTITEDCHRHFLEEGRPLRAAMNALDIGFTWLLRGEVAIGSGWVSRARRLLEDQPECAERGFLAWIDAAEALEGGDLDSALVGAVRIQELGHQFETPTLVCLGLVLEGMIAIRHGQVDKGFAMLDEAMLPVLAGRVPPEWAGNIYCQLMTVCHDLADVRRARQWTAATERWCDSFASAVMFVGVCRIHRIQLLQLHGDWMRAEQEASIACEELADMNVSVVAEAHYQLAELRMLRDDLVGAEESYQRAGGLGRNPQPGFALLHLHLGRTAEAAASIRTALADSTNRPFHRARLLVAQVEIALSRDEIAVAVVACRELDDIARTYATAGFRAWAGHARGAVLLAQGHADEGLRVLRHAFALYCDMEAPYEAAAVRSLRARAYGLLGDREAAALEWEAAAATYAQLGAALQIRRGAETSSRAVLPGGLTAREIEVLAYIAGGATNQEVAAALFISQKTVARHLANIFVKLGLTSRTAAAAWAHEHRLTRRRTGT
ncbi:MAG: helix-turn-helix transcriptional regulator [Geodermatophilaceae bacterium]|nr:helix-turn-helix transcriptional regulator [Geodermatophilaceae bacterium]